MATYNYTSSTGGTAGHPSNAAVPYVITSQVVDAAGVQASEGFGRFGKQRRVSEITLGHLAVATRAKRRVHVELKVEPEAPLRPGLTHRAEDVDQRLGGAELLGLCLISQPIAAGLDCRGGRQPHAPPAAMHARKHLAGLPP